MVRGFSGGFERLDVVCQKVASMELQRRPRQKWRGLFFSLRIICGERCARRLLTKVPIQQAAAERAI